MLRIFFLLLPFVFALCLVQCTNSNAREGVQQVKQHYQLRLHDFRGATDSLFFSLQHSSPAQWQAAFHKARAAYKNIELITDYYYPTTAKAINGPPVVDVEADEPEKEIAPSGFQVMEEWLFPEADTAAIEGLLVQAKMLQSLTLRLQNGFASLELSDSHLFDAARLHLLRLISMGLSGADNGIAQNSITEAAISLQSLHGFLSPYRPSSVFATLITNAVHFLQKDTSFHHFDRAAFVVQYARPLWHQLYLLQTEKGIPFLKEMGLVNTASPYLFDSAFFNTAGFSGAQEAAGTSLVPLGRMLFSDKRLSGNNTRSCASCHQPQKHYATNLAKNRSIDGRSVIFRNTPTILYAALQPVQFADSRVSFLEDQAKAVIQNHSEMKGDLKKIVKQLAADTAYQSETRKVFGKNTLSEEEITKALAAFIRSQAPFSSPFDAYLKGNKKALSTEAIKGFNLFMGKAKCGTCHFMPLFNGVVPPHYTKMESEVIGVPQSTGAPFQLDGDEGKYRFTGSLVHRFAFKTPTLRNIARTAPYMHNGVYQTLEEVMDFYEKGGGAGLGLSLPGQTLPAEPLNLTNEEKKAILAFLHTLTDE